MSECALVLALSSAMRVVHSSTFSYVTVVDKSAIMTEMFAIVTSEPEAVSGRLAVIVVIIF